MSNTTLKKFIKSCVPPILLEPLRKKVGTFLTYSSYEEAMNDADGYEDELLTKVVVAKGNKFAKNIETSKELDLKSLRTFIGIASALRKSKLTIIDFGGAAGAHYFIAKSILKDVELDWRVVETQAMVAEARSSGLENNELQFFADLASACDPGPIDLVFASGSVHYTPKPYECLASLAALNARIFMLTRTPITESPCVILQRSTLSSNGVGEIPKELNIQDKTISYPVTMMDKSRVEKILSSFGDITLRIVEDQNAYRSNKGSFDMWGYIVRKA